MRIVDQSVRLHFQRIVKDTASAPDMEEAQELIGGDET